jgi:hypothetical protein
MAATLGQIGNGYPGLSTGGYAFGVTLEPGIRNSEPNGGYAEDRPIPLNDWRTATDAALGTSAGATPYRALANTSVPCIVWRQDAAATDLIRTSFIVPGQYDPKVDDLRLIVSARKVDAAADENTDLALGCIMRFSTSGQTDPTLSATTTPAAPGALINGYTPAITGDTALTAATQVNRQLIGSSTGANVSTFALYEFNLGANGLYPCDRVILELFPHETVGTVDMVVQLDGTSIRWHRNSSLFSRQLRFSDKAIFGN